MVTYHFRADVDVTARWRVRDRIRDLVFQDPPQGPRIGMHGAVTVRGNVNRHTDLSGPRVLPPRLHSLAQQTAEIDPFSRHRVLVELREIDEIVDRGHQPASRASYHSKRPALIRMQVGGDQFKYADHGT